jgi:NAD(P)-dependent dehydrogenase (short-subunit alcohol dehydrogenase family)
MRQAVIDRFGRANILMNNAGVLPVGPPETLPLSEWQRALQVNLLSAVAATQVFFGDLAAAQEAHIVNTASFAGLISYDPFTLAYNVSKAAVVSFSEGLAVYLRPRNIGVTCLCPGPVVTNIGEQVRAHGEPPAKLGAFAVKYSAGRTADEVGAMVVEAIRQNRFLLATDVAILDQVREHGADPEGFIDKIVETLKS